jgi:hypothetical protein
MCASKVDEKILKEAREIAKMKGLDVNEFLSQTIKESLETEKRWRGGFFGKRRRLGKARIVEEVPRA